MKLPRFCLQCYSFKHDPQFEGPCQGEHRHLSGPSQKASAVSLPSAAEPLEDKHSDGRAEAGLIALRGRWAAVATAGRAQLADSADKSVEIALASAFQPLKRKKGVCSAEALITGWDHRAAVSSVALAMLGYSAGDPGGVRRTAATFIANEAA
jgi:hypothetical protein